jgi:quercetin dioxygenase-like cupin family protein
MKTVLVVAAVLVATVWPVAAPAQLPETQVVLENPSVRIVLLTFVPGGATGRHQGVEAEIGIVLEGELTVDGPDGRQTLRPGGAYWMPGLTPHDVRNEGPGPARLWDIILKRCE